NFINEINKINDKLLYILEIIESENCINNNLNNKQTCINKNDLVDNKDKRTENKQGDPKDTKCSNNNEIDVNNEVEDNNTINNSNEVGDNNTTHDNNEVDDNKVEDNIINNNNTAEDNNTTNNNNIKNNKINNNEIENKINHKEIITTLQNISKEYKNIYDIAKQEISINDKYTEYLDNHQINMNTPMNILLLDYFLRLRDKINYPDKEYKKNKNK
ncbi:hypothetical protein SLOPH_2586, partial [Spraguea lophii 42_110]